MVFTKYPGADRSLSGSVLNAKEDCNMQNETKQVLSGRSLSGTIRIEDDPDDQRYCWNHSEYCFDGDTVEVRNGWGMAALRAFHLGFCEWAMEAISAGAGGAPVAQLTVERNSRHSVAERTARMMARTFSRFLSHAYPWATCHEPIVAESADVRSLKAITTLRARLKRDELIDAPRPHPGDRILAFRLLETVPLDIPPICCLRALGEMFCQIPRAEIGALRTFSHEGFEAILPERYRQACVTIARQHHMVMIDTGCYRERA